MAVNAFKVLSEFRFDVGQAVLASDQLQGRVDSLSNSVNEAMYNVQRLGMGFITQFSGAGGGILGILGTAIQAADKFKDSQLSFTQIIDSNVEHLTGSIGTLNEKMAASKNIMNDIAKDAIKFGIPAAELLDMTKTLSAMLVPKGLAGENFGAARSLSRNLLKSAPNLGINPADVQGQLLRSIEGSASMGDTLFRRLLTEAPEAFKEAKVKDAKGFNQLDATKRFNILNDAMAKFANNSDILAMRANTLSGVFQRVRDLFMGFTSVLRPLGEAILPPLIQILNIGIEWLNTKGRTLVKMFSDFIKPMIENPKELFIGLSQIADLSKDFKSSIGLAGVALLFMHLQEIVHFLAKMPFIGPAMQALQAFMGSMKPLQMLFAGITWIMSNLGTVLRFLWPLIKIALAGILQFSAGVAAFLIPLQGLTRAFARAKIELVDWVAENSVAIASIAKRFSEAFGIFMMPIQDMIKGWEELFYTIIGGTSVLDFMKDQIKTFSYGLKLLAEGFLYTYAAIRGFIAGFVGMWAQAILNISQIVQNLLSGNFSDPLFGTENIFGEGMKNATEEFMKTIGRAQSPLQDGNVDNAKVSNMVNNYDVKMTNNFKEVLQPDRIAFTIKDQLEKSSRNRTSATVSGTAALQQKSI